MRAAQAVRMMRLEKMGLTRFIPRLEAGSRVLIVGAGPSATEPAVAAVRGDFDTTITLNSGWKAAPDAEVISYEFAFRDVKKYELQKQELGKLDLRNVVFKPHALMMMSSTKRAALMHLFLDFASGHAMRFVPHNNVPSTYLAKRRRLLDRKCGRLPVQWKGSLTMWLDLCWLSQVGTVGLIGTDLGDTQADGSFLHHPTNAIDASAPPLLSTLEKLHSAGYLSGIKFHHFHGNHRFRAILDE